MNSIQHNDAASLGFGRSIFAANIEITESHLIGAGTVQAKVLSQRIPLASPTKQHQLNGFFAPIDAVCEY